MAKISSKELVRRCFSRCQPQIPPFIPWVCSHAAKLEQIPVQKMFTSSTLLAKALEGAQKLYGYDAVLNIFDPTLEAEACGCTIAWGGEQDLPQVVSHPLGEGMKCEALDISEIEKRGRLPVVLETTKRLAVTMGQSVALVGVVTGPLTLASHLKGTDIVRELETSPESTNEALDLAGKAIVKICRQYCELNIDVLVVAERLLTRVPAPLICKITPYLRPIWNITRFYCAYPVILTGDCIDVLQGEAIIGLGADGIALSSLPISTLSAKAQERKSCLGVTIPLSMILGKEANIISNLASYLPSEPVGYHFITTEWEIPFDTRAENMHELMRGVQSYSESFSR